MDAAQVQHSDGDLHARTYACSQLHDSMRQLPAWLRSSQQAECLCWLPKPFTPCCCAAQCCSWKRTACCLASHVRDWQCLACSCVCGPMHVRCICARDSCIAIQLCMQHINSACNPQICSPQKPHNRMSSRDSITLKKPHAQRWNEADSQGLRCVVSSSIPLMKSQCIISPHCTVNSLDAAIPNSTEHLLDAHSL